MIEASQIGAEPGAEPMKITRAQLMMVIRQRVEELTNEIEAALKASASPDRSAVRSC